MESRFDGRIWGEDEADLSPMEDAQEREHLIEKFVKVRSELEKAKTVYTPNVDEIRRLETEYHQVLQEWWRYTRKT
jgi:hypothetical protein